MFGAARLDLLHRLDAPPLIGVDPRIAQRDATRVFEQFIETPAGLQIAIVTGVIDSIVPLQSLLQRLPADIAGANKRAPPVQPAEQVGLEMKTAASALVDAHLRACSASSISRRKASGSVTSR